MARPPLRGEPATRVLHLRVTETEWQAVQHLAHAHSMTVGALMAEAVSEYVGDCEERGLFRQPIYLVSSPTVTSS